MRLDTELLFTGIPPVGEVEGGAFSWRGRPSFSRAWFAKAKSASRITVLSGFVSADAIVELERLIQKSSSIERFDICVGMAKFEGLTRPQIDALQGLQGTLEVDGRGGVYVASPWRFHGKVSVFSVADGPLGAIVGSSNISALMGPNQYECDVLLNGGSQLLEISNFAKDVLSDGCEPFGDVKVKEEESDALRDFLGVKPKIGADRVASRAAALASTTKYDMPLKASDEVQKSGLNVFFGKGRVNTQRTFERPRPWYEIEIQPGRDWYREAGSFPGVDVHFKVVTDDGYEFECYSSFDPAWNGPKNFRSAGDLQILGRWIKGRLEASGCLKLGSPVTDEVLASYGRSTVSFSLLTDGSWFADFSRPD